MNILHFHLKLDQSTTSKSVSATQGNIEVKERKERLGHQYSGSRASECANANRVVAKVTNSLSDNPVDESTLTTASLALDDNSARWVTLFCKKIIHMLIEDVKIFSG